MKKTSRSRLQALLDRLPQTDGQMVERLVVRCTAGRTGELCRMTPAECRALCDALEAMLRDPRSVQREELRRRRSEALHLMQRLGIDTSDWVRVDAFCRDARIAGKRFAALGAEELRALSVKLRSIARRGGLKPQQPNPAPRTRAAAVQVVWLTPEGPVS